MMRPDQRIPGGERDSTSRHTPKDPIPRKCSQLRALIETERAAPFERLKVKKKTQTSLRRRARREEMLILCALSVSAGSAFMVSWPIGLQIPANIDPARGCSLRPENGYNISMPPGPLARKFTLNDL